MSDRTLSRRIAVVFVGVSLLVATSAARAQGAPTVAEQAAMEQMEQGKLLYIAKRYDDALAKLQRAADIRPSAVTTHNIALCHHLLGHYVLAWQLYHRALDQNKKGIGSALEANEVEQIERSYLPEIEQKIARVRVHVGHVGISVAIDGRPLETDMARGIALVGSKPFGLAEAPPWQSFELLADPGAHVIVVSREGYEDSVIVQRFSSGHNPPLTLRAPTVRKPPKAPTAAARDTEEIIILYGAVAAFSVETGIFASAWRDTKGAKERAIVGVPVGAAALLVGAAAVGLADRYLTIPRGLPHAIASGLYVGFEAGVFAGFLSLGRDDTHFSNVRAAGWVWGSSLVGAVAGGIVGSVIPPPPSQSSFVISGAAWGGLFSGFVSGGIAGSLVDPSRSTSWRNLNIALALGGGAGTVVGAATTALLAPLLRFSTARLRYIDLGGLAGTATGFAAGTLYSLFATKRDKVSLSSSLELRPQVLIFTAAGTALGLTIGTALTRDIDKTGAGERCSAGASFEPTFSPEIGGASLGARGVF